MKYINERTGLLILVMVLCIMAFTEFIAHRLLYALSDVLFGFVIFIILRDRIKEKFFKFPVEEGVNDEL